MNKYELTIVVEGKGAAAKKKKVVETLEKLLNIFKGKIVENNDWGVKDLAYKLGKNTQGGYLHFILELDPSTVKALNEKIRTDGDILRFLLIRAN